MRTGLFRDEALIASRDKHLGEVSLSQPVSVLVLTASSVIAIVVLLAFVLVGEYTRKAHVTGYLVPSLGVAKVYAPEPGTLIEQNVRDGQFVRRGDALFVLSTERTSPETQAAQGAAIAKLRERRDSLVEEVAKQTDIAAIEQRILRDRIAGMERDLDSMRGQIGLQHERLELSRVALGRFKALEASHAVSVLQAEQQQQQVLDQEYLLRTLERDVASRERELGQLRMQLDADDLKATNVRGGVSREVAALEQQITEYESRRNLVITAPSDGIATAILAQRGQAVQSSSVLLSILPEGAELEALLLVPTRAIGFVVDGQNVAVRYQAFPYQRFGSHDGVIVDVDKAVTRPADLDFPLATEEPGYRVRVRMSEQSVAAYGERVPLQAGMALDADIAIDRRKIVQWIFDPVLSITGRL